MKVLLINPPNLQPKKYSFPSLVYQPTGLAYLAAVLMENKIKVSIMDALAEGWNQERIEAKWRITGLSDDEMESKIRETEPDVVGVGMAFSYHEQMGIRVLKLVKKLNKNIFTITGGANASIRYKSLLKKNCLDAVIIGEGEVTIMELIKTLAGNLGLNRVKGIAFKKNNRIIKTKTREYIKDLDSLPFPARQLLPMNEYYEAAKRAQAGRVVSTLGKRWATMITSRGCPFKCIFCTIHQIMGRNWRARSPENVLKEIRELIKNYKIEHILFEDDNLTLDLKRAKKIFQLMINKRLKVEWSTPNGVRADKVDEELVELMKESGCTRLCVAPESGSQEVIDKIIGKGLDLKNVEHVVSWCKKYKLPVEAFFIVGFPGETKQQMQETLDFAKKLLSLGLDEFSLFLATPFYGTKLYDVALKKGYLKPSFSSQDLRVEFQDIESKPLIQTEDFRYQDLLDFRRQALKLSPKFSLGKIKLGSKVFIANPKLALKLAWGRLK